MTMLLMRDLASERSFISQFYPIPVPHDVLSVQSVRFSVHGHTHVRPERIHISFPILEELSEHEVFLVDDPGEFQVDDGEIFVRMHGLMDRSETKTLGYFDFFSFDEYLERRMPMQSVL